MVISLLLLLILVPLNVYWNMDRTNKFQVWRTQYQEAQAFTFFGMEKAASLLNTTNFRTNNTAQNWYQHEMVLAQLELSDIGTTDTAHGSQLIRTALAIYTMGTDMIYVLQLNDSQRTTLSGYVQTIGNDILNAYTKYGDFTNMNNWTLLWYSGSAPPDENLLNQAYTLATTLPGLPTLPT